MVTNGTLIQAASFGGNAFITALAVSLNFGKTLLTADRPTAVGVTSGLAVVTHAGRTGVLLPLLAVLVLCPC